jgi:putative transposase
MFDRRDCPEMDRNLLEAAWRFQVVAPLLPGRMSRQERTEHRKALLKEPVDHPWRGRLPLSARTLRRWCKIAREGGMAGLVASARKDRGTMKRFPAAALKRALELREEDATRGTTILMRLILAENPEWKGILSYTTLGRHLRAAGSRRGQRVDRKGPFISFEAAAPHDLWQGDILYGPPVLHKGKPVRSMVVCWLDDRSRAVCHLEAYPDQSQAAIEDSLRKAIAKHGAPVSVFVDNAMVYSGKAFTLACSELGITKVHSTPRYPVSRGKQERFFRTLRDQLLNEVANVEPMELPELNRVLVAWLATYHSTPHSRTEQTPAERLRGAVYRPVSAEMLEQAFWQWATRSISVQGEIRFEGNRYQVGLEHADQAKAVLRYDPSDMRRLFLWKEGRVLATARAVDLVHRVSRRRPAQGERKSEAARNYLRRLEQAHVDRLAREMNLTRYQDEEGEVEP